MGYSARILDIRTRRVMASLSDRVNRCLYVIVIYRYRGVVEEFILPDGALSILMFGERDFEALTPSG
jgi:hypothetical protein